MAHELSIREDGTAEMAYVGQDRPWHGLGQSLSKDSTIEEWQTQAGFDWEVKSSPVKFSVPGGTTRTFADRQALYRSDTEAPLSIVSESYKIVQPKEVLEFFRDLVGQAGMYLETAGMLFGGARFWAMANTNNSILLNGNDRVKGNLLLSTSVDGKIATSAMLTSVRVVCNNTLRIALTENQTGRVRVTHRSTFDPENIKKQLGLIDASWEKFAKSIEKMSKTKISDNDAFEDFKKLICKDIAEPTNREIAVVQTLQGMHTGTVMGYESAKGTVWNMLNCITQRVDHDLGRLPSHQLSNAWYGNGAKAKDDAFNYFLEKYVGDVALA